ncbi:MAG: hypothetical protein ABIC91_08750 [Nanoarchaeota archaeon]
MNKKMFLSIFMLTLFLSGATSVGAISTSTQKIIEIRQQIQDEKQKVMENRAGLKAQIASTTENITENRKEVRDARIELKNAIEIKIGKKLEQRKIQIANVFEKIIQNLKDLIVRIESRMLKMTTNNINVSSSVSLLDIAKIKVTLADTELTNLENLLTQDIPAVASSTKKSERKTILQQIKTQSEKTKTAIKTAHKAIIDVIVSLKPGLLKEKDATSTLQTASTTNN